MLPLIVKWVHIVGAMLFIGTGFGSAWYKMRAHRSSDLRVIAWCDREIVRADWFFTVPSGVLMPVTGLWLAYLYRLPWTTPWILRGIVGYTIAGIFWLPAAALQLRMRRIVDACLASNEPLPAAYHRAQRQWMLLGGPSFAAAVYTLWVMVAKYAA